MENIAYPFSVETSGRINTYFGLSESIKQNLRILLLTQKGERVMEPEYGVNLPQFLFTDEDANNVGLIKLLISEAVARWEPRVKIENINVAYVLDDQPRIIVTLTYSIVNMDTLENLTLTF